VWTPSQSNAYATSDKILRMRNRKHSEQIERMLNVMLCMPKSAWGSVLEKVEKKIEVAALRRIILRAYEESDLKRGVAILDKRPWIAELGLALRSARAAKCGAMILAAVLTWLFLEAGE
jgi:hypothetical protein